MTLYWIRNINSNRPTVLTYSSNQTSINRAARDVFNGKHSPYFPKLEKKHDPTKDVLLFSDEQIVLRSFHHDELQEESEDS